VHFITINLEGRFPKYGGGKPLIIGGLQLGSLFKCLFLLNISFIFAKKNCGTKIALRHT
jgi:hypothetical protein